MKPERVLQWFSIFPIILVLFGILYAFFGLGTLPVDRAVFREWESDLYGAIMMGWGVTLFFVGRLAIQRNDSDLLKALLYGLTIWLLVEALFSAFPGVWFNVGVDIGVLVLFSLPLKSRIQK